MKILRIFVSSLIIFIVYMVMAGNFSHDELITGAILSIFISILYPSLAGDRPLKWFNPKRYIYFLIYIPVFLWAMVKANLDVARRVVTPSLPIKPGIVKIKTKLKNPVGKMILANSITLTPGTLTVDLVGNYLYIHWIEVKDKDVEKATKDIALLFEKYLEVIFD